MTDRYDDTVQWVAEQVAALRAGRFRDLDIEGIAEELHGLARRELHGFEEVLVQLLSLWLRVQAWPDIATEGLRRYEVADLREAAADLYSPAMRPEIDLQHLYRRALHLLPETVEGKPPLPLPEACPLTLDELLAARADGPGSK